MGSTSKTLEPKRILFAAAWMALSVACAGSATPAQARGTPDSFAELSEKLLPTVVNIATTATMTPDAALAQMPDTEDESQLKDFFKKFMEKNKALPRRVSALGSGFIIDRSGLIVTNQHVIDGADTITVTFNDGSTLPATLVGRDDKTDLALLQVHPKSLLTAAEFGDSDRAHVGDWVIAIGDPFGLGSSVTAGIVSARNRDIAAGPYDDFIQTDAPINRGNSGGPLFDMDGHVVGVASAIYSPSGGSVGVGFAIPSNMAKSVIAQLRQYGHARRGWMGVRIQSLNGEIADSLGLASQTGALVADVTAGGPAARAGLKNGDLITQYNGSTVPDSRVLSRLVADTPVGNTVAVEVLRNGQKQNLRITVAQLDDAVEQGGAARAPNVVLPKAVPGFSQLGLSVAAPDARLRTKYKLHNTDGVVITNIDPAGSAADEDLHEGDMILEVQNEAVHTPGDVAKRVNASANSGRKAVLFRVSRDGESSYIAVRLAGGG